MFKSLRQSQLISPWGIGQIVNFPGDESLMVAGLDAWERVYNSAQDKNEFIIHEARLEKRLRVSHFRLPPDYREKGGGVINTYLKIPFIRFPKWHYCYFCGSMERLTIYQRDKQRCKGPEYSKGRSCFSKPEYKRQYMMPLRFIAICPDGHIEDFPYMEWVHYKKPFSLECSLRYLVGRASGALASIKIECTCGESRTLKGSFNSGALDPIKKCSGERPWLGEVGELAKGCGNELRVVQRGAANVYFPDIRSSIYLSNWDDSEDSKINEVLEKNWNLLSALKDGALIEERFEMVAEQTNVDPKRLFEAGLKRFNQELDEEESEDDSEEAYRKSEYDELAKKEDKDSDDFLIKHRKVKEYGSLFEKYFNSVSLVEKLRETRALVGFSRILPEDGKSLREKRSELAISNTVNWLPAIIVRGEGVFLEFNNDLLEAWEQKKEVKDRAEVLINNYNQARVAYDLPERKLNARFILLHTFAHLMINQLSLKCGYGSSSLRERIYCDTEDVEKMNGILLYTAAGDSEGSLGGLIKQGRPGNLERLFLSALHEAEWCSSDPVCIQSFGQGPGSCNLAACHNCALLPETSCEEGNRLLDRGLLIGIMDNPDLGFFKDYL